MIECNGRNTYSYGFHSWASDGSYSASLNGDGINGVEDGNGEFAKFTVKTMTAMTVKRRCRNEEAVLTGGVTPLKKWDHT